MVLLGLAGLAVMGRAMLAMLTADEQLRLGHAASMPLGLGAGLTAFQGVMLGGGAALVALGIVLGAMGRVGRHVLPARCARCGRRSRRPRPCWLRAARSTGSPPKTSPLTRPPTAPATARRASSSSGSTAWTPGPSIS